MDKSWMMKDRLSTEYELGVNNFIENGLQHSIGHKSIWCPCLRCANSCLQDVDEVRDHLFIHGIDQTYKTWIWDGEQVPNKETNEGLYRRRA